MFFLLAKLINFYWVQKPIVILKYMWKIILSDNFNILFLSLYNFKFSTIQQSKSLFFRK